MYKGTWGNYHWVVSSEGSLWDLLVAVPELVVGRLVVVTSFDSGPLHLSDSELGSGWQQRGPLAISPRIVDVSVLPCDNHDEWYVFEEAVPAFDDTEPFVNYLSFSPIPLDQIDWDDTWDRQVRRHLEELQDSFWSTLDRLDPYSYLADNGLVSVVTKSEAQRNRAWEALAALK